MRRKYYIYIRVSSETQTDGLSLDAQRIACLGAGPRGCAPVFHEDVGSAYKHTSLPSRTKMLKSLTRNATLIVYRLDRLSRNVNEARIILNKLEELNITLITTDKGVIDYKNKRDDVIDMFREAEAESDRLSTRAIFARDAIIASGGYPGTYIPYGYVRTGTQQILPDERETSVMNMVYLLVNNDVHYESLNEHLLALTECTEPLIPCDEFGNEQTHFCVRDDFNYIAKYVLNWYNIFRRDGSLWTGVKLKADYERWIKIRRLSITDDLENLINQIAL